MGTIDMRIQMRLYTFLAEYDGGSYVSQVKAPNPPSAIFEWAQNMDVKSIPGLGLKSKEQLLQELTQAESEGYLYVAIQGLHNVWCVTAFLRGKLMLVTFVETQEPKPG